MVFTQSGTFVSHAEGSRHPSCPPPSCSPSSTASRHCLVMKAILLSLAAITTLSSIGMALVGRTNEVRFQLARVRNILRRWKCPGGGYPAGSQNSKVLCLKCPVGHFCLGKFNPPRKCSPGKYQHHQGQQFCFVCPRGFYNQVPGQTGCHPASPGSYVVKPGQLKQAPCPQNTYQSKKGQKNCIPCPSGTVSGRGATACSSGLEAICGNRCPKTNSPVCGWDGISYPNKCVLGCTLQPAKCHNKCPCESTPLPVVEGAKLATKRKCVCPKIYAPVCGMDSKTYGNPCLAHCVEKVVACRGKCPCRLLPPPMLFTHRPTRRPTSRPVVGLVFGSKPVNAKHPVKDVTWTSKYFYVRQRLGWKHAQDYCVRKGTQLAVIHSMKEHSAVADACQDECWIGGDRGSMKDGFGWSDESRIDFENWAPGEPKTGLCMQTNGTPNQKWAGADCERALPFVCQNDNNFHVKLANEPAVLYNISRKKMWIISTTVVAVSLLGFAGVLVWYAYCVIQNKTNGVIEEVEEVVSERTPLIHKHTTQA